MARKFLENLLSRPKVQSVAVAQAVAELSQLEERQPALRGPAALLRNLLPLLAVELPCPVRLPFAREQLAARSQDGLPWLRGESPDFGARSVRSQWLKICRILVKHGASGDGAKLADAVSAGRLDPTNLLHALLDGRSEVVSQQALSLGIDPGFLGTVIRLCFYPYLVKLRESLPTDVKSNRGFCPYCGSWPLLAELRGLELARYLRCGLCAGEWEFAWLACPFCGNRDHDLLGSLTAEGEELKAHIAICDRCRGFVKSVNTLARLDAFQLLVTDVSTLPLDLIAADRGYSPPNAT